MTLIPRLAAPRRISAILLCGLMLAAFAIDLRTPWGWSDWVMYLIVVVLGMRVVSLRLLVVLAALASTATVLGSVLGPHRGEVESTVFARSLGLVLTWTAVWVAWRWRRSDEEVRRVNRALKTLSECNQAMVRARDEAELLQNVCHLLVEVGNFGLAWVGYAEQDAAKTIRPAVWAGKGGEFLTTARLSWAEIEPGGVASAERDSRICLVRHAAGESAPHQPATEALKCDYPACISFPLVRAELPFGALSLCSLSADAFDAEEVKLLSELAHDLAYGIQALRDRAERILSANELRRANAYNRSLIEASLDPLVTISPEGKITDVNLGTEKVTGRTRQELIGTDFSDYFTAPERARAGYQSVFRDGSVQDYELAIRHRDGRITPVLYNATVYRDEAGEVVGVFAAARDVAERKRAEAEIHALNESLEQRVRERTAELEAANKELEAFTYSVSHDLRAPLRHVDGFSKLLLEDFADRLPAEARHHLERIRNGTRQMGNLVDDLLNLSRIGRREPSLQITGLGSLVEEIIAELKAENRDRRIEWKVASLPFVECDPALMKQVLANLMSNAVKFTRPRETAEIDIGVRRQDGHDAIYVRDNGVGFSMKFADKLFGVFQRLHRAEDFEGAGVGLATVQRIIHKHHGEVWAEAELDRGATFYFTLGSSPTGAQTAKGEAA